MQVQCDDVQMLTSQQCAVQKPTWTSANFFFVTLFFTRAAVVFVPLTTGVDVPGSGCRARFVLSRGQTKTLH